MTAKIQNVKKNLAGIGAQAEKTSKQTDKVKESLGGIKGDYSASILLRDRASQGIQRAMAGLRGFSRGDYSAVIGVKDRATEQISRIKSELTGFAGKTYTAVMNVKGNLPQGGMGGGLKDAASGMMMGMSAQMMGAADIGFGEALIFGNPKLKRLTFSGFFPHPKHEYPFITGDSMMPTEIVEMLLKWKESKQPIRVIITDSPVNLMMGLKDFDYSEKDGTRDIYYRLSFIEYKDLNTPLANNDKQVNDATGLKERASDMQKPDTATFQQRANDVLDASKKPMATTLIGAMLLSRTA